MDAYQLMSTFRSFPELSSEEKIGTPDLLKILSRAHRHVFTGLSVLYPGISRIWQTKTSISANPYFMPGAKRILRLYRHNGTAYKYATFVPIELEHLINNSPHYQASTDHPLYTIEGQTIAVYPTLSSTNVQIEFERDIPDLITGFGAVAINGDGYYAVQLDELSVPVVDFYKGYFIALYKEDASGAFNHVGQYIITANNVSRSAATDQTVANTLLSTATYIYALCPVISEEYDNLIYDVALAELSKAGLLKFDAASLILSVENQIAKILEEKGPRNG